MTAAEDGRVTAPQHSEAWTDDEMLPVPDSDMDDQSRSPGDGGDVDIYADLPVFPTSSPVLEESPHPEVHLTKSEFMPPRKFILGFKILHERFRRKFILGFLNFARALYVPPK